MAEHNINLDCGVCDRVQDINWAMGGFLLVPGDSPIDLVTQVICQPCAPGEYAQSLMSANRKWNGGSEESWQAIKDSLPPNLYPVVLKNDNVGIFKSIPPNHYY